MQMRPAATENGGRRMAKNLRPNMDRGGLERGDNKNGRMIQNMEVATTIGGRMHKDMSMRRHKNRTSPMEGNITDGHIIQMMAMTMKTGGRTSKYMQRNKNKEKIITGGTNTDGVWREDVQRFGEEQE